MWEKQSNAHFDEIVRLTREREAHYERLERLGHDFVAGECKCPPNTRCWSDCGEKTCAHCGRERSDHE